MRRADSNVRRTAEFHSNDWRTSGSNTHNGTGLQVGEFRGMSRPAHLRAALWLACLLGLVANAAYPLQVDGVLEETEWATAQSFRDFRITEPLTRDTPRYATELRVLPMPDALYVAFRSEQPRSERTHGRSPRDAPNMDGDPAILIIDFEGQGRNAYEFTTSISGSRRDSVILNQSDLSRDWDANWISAVHEDDQGWSVEWRIPWSVAPEGATGGNKRTLGIYAALYAKKAAQRYALPAIELLGPTFVHEFIRFEVPRYSTASLDWFPYASIGSDRLRHATTGNAGLDMVWKPNGQNQVSLAVNPDFGQVESDNLVVNFSAIESFFDEKRPFFTEGQQLFDLRTPQNGRLVNTRRIGAAPDAGSEGGTDVIAAGKYTGIHGAQEYGVFAAAEDNSSTADGRRFAVGRWRYKGERGSMGYLATWTQHPTLERDAQVHAIDYDWRLRPALTLRGQSLMSAIQQRPVTANNLELLDTRGFGTWLALDYQPGGRWDNFSKITYFDRKLDFNDLGFQERNGLVHLESSTHWFVRRYKVGSWADNGNWQLNVNVPFNDSGDRLVGTAELGHYLQWRNGGDSYFYYFHEFSGIDDLLSRGNGRFRLPTRQNAGGEYTSPQSGAFRYFVAVRLREQGLRQFTRELQFNPKWFFTENLSLGVQLDYYHSPDWLLWSGGDQLTRYKRDELDAAANLNWYPAPKHELRAKLQWVGLAARSVQSYRIEPDGRLTPIATRAADFSLSTLGVQIRYRYEFKPLSELYMVYSRGGDGSVDGESVGLHRSLDLAINNTTADQLFVKLRYQF